MLRRGAGLIAVVAVLSAGVMGCGGDGPSDGGTGLGAVDLTRWLPPGGDVYTSVDVAAVKRSLGVPADFSLAGGGSDAAATLSSFTSDSVGGLYSTYPTKPELSALDLSAVTATASTSVNDHFVSAFETSAATDVIRSRLLALGFADHGGVLEGPAGRRAIGKAVPSHAVVRITAGAKPENFPPPPHGALAVRINGADFLLSDDADLLRRLPSSPGELPMQIETSLEGDSMLAVRSAECTNGSGVVTNMDGSGKFVFLVRGGADAARFKGGAADAVGAPQVDGDLLTVGFHHDPPEPPGDVQAEVLPRYNCDK